MKYLAYGLLLRTTTLALSMLSLIACNDANKAQTSLPDKEPTQTTEPEESTVERTSDLVAPSDMKFISHNQIQLSVDIGAQGGIPAYLSVYSSYEELAEAQWQVDYDSRMLASSLIKDKTQHTFSVPQHLNNVLVQLWFYDGRAAISREVAVNQNSNEEIIVTL
ncbi:MAG: hypothetical protein V7765_12770 [Oleispira sp.]